MADTDMAYSLRWSSHIPTALPELTPSIPLVHVPVPEAHDNFLQTIRQTRPMFHPPSVPFDGGTISLRELPMWKYEDRHKAQQVLSYLWIGPSIVAKSPQWFTDTAITMAIGVSAAPIKFMITAALQRISNLGIETHCLDLSGPQDNVKTFRDTYILIYDHYLSQYSRGVSPRILVFCDSGNIRSISVVSAFLMQAYDNVDHLRAAQVTQAVRFSAGWSAEHKQILSTFHDILQAQRLVGSSGSISSRGQKRVMDRAEETNMIADESELLEERKAYAPFRDLDGQWEATETVQ